MSIRSYLTVPLMLCMLAAVDARPAAAQQKFITVGAGALTGVYYPAGGAICRLVNKNRTQHGIRCSAESTAGSIYNLNAIRSGELDFAVAQSDWQFNSVKGADRFESTGPDTALRALFSLFPEPFTVVARKDASIRTFDDLKGKRVNVGNPGSGPRGTMEVLMAEKGWKMSDFSLAAELKPDEQAKALCDNKVDAVVVATGHPSGYIHESTSVCEAVLVEVTGAAVDKLVKERPYYAYASIPGGMYQGNPADVKTYGVKATFVASTKVPPEIVYIVVKAVFDNLDEFKKLHPAFEHLDPKSMISEGNAAPLHEGAIRYYKEKGLM